MKIVALATCRNRRQLTLRALESLHRQAIPQRCSIEICIVDDGSHDGTAEAIHARFPLVKVLKGSGDLFWAGGMRFAWTSYGMSEDPDFLLVFNDDIDLRLDALHTLIATASALEADGCSAYAVSGAFRNPDDGTVAYGGAVRSSRWHPLRFGTVPPADVITECDTVNMNFTLISRTALRRVGFLASEFTHGMADYDFGLRLRKVGGRVVLAPGYVGECRVNPIDSKSSQVGLRFAERWHRLTSVKEQPPRERAAYYRRHGGCFWPVYFVLPYLRVCVVAGLGFMKNALGTLRFK